MPYKLAVIGFQEIALLLLIVVVIFGASRLPQLGAGLGKGIRNFKKSISEDDDEDKKLNESNEKA